MSSHSVDLAEYEPQLFAEHDLMSSSSDEEVVEAPVPPAPAPPAPAPGAPQHRLPVTHAARNMQLKKQLHRSQRRRIALQNEVDVAREADRELKKMYNDLVLKYNKVRGDFINARDYNLVAATELAEVKEERDEYATALKQIRDVVVAQQNLDD